MEPGKTNIFAHRRERVKTNGKFSLQSIYKQALFIAKTTKTTNNSEVQGIEIIERRGKELYMCV